MTHISKTIPEEAVNQTMEELVKRGRTLHARAVATALVKLVDHFQLNVGKPKGSIVRGRALKKA